MTYTELGTSFKQKIEAISGLSPRQKVQLLREIAAERGCSFPVIIEKVIESKGCFDLFSLHAKTSTDRIRVFKEIRRLESISSPEDIRILCQFFGAFDAMMLDTEDLIISSIGDESKISWVDDEIPKKSNFFPWARLFARNLDFTISTFVIGILFVIFFPDQSLENPATDMKLTLVAVVLSVLIVEPFLISMYGTTPGKRLYGIYVLNSEGKPLSLRDSIKRSLMVFVRGDWLAIPGLIAIGRLRAYFRYEKFGVTLWDERLGITYKHPTCSGARILFTNFLIFSVTFVVFVAERFSK